MGRTSRAARHYKVNRHPADAGKVSYQVMREQGARLLLGIGVARNAETIRHLLLRQAGVLPQLENAAHKTSLKIGSARRCYSLPHSKMMRAHPDLVMRRFVLDEWD